MMPPPSVYANLGRLVRLRGGCSRGSNGLFPPELDQRDIMTRVHQSMTAVISLFEKSRALIEGLEAPSSQ
jgi:hypothetical protein